MAERAVEARGVTYAEYLAMEERSETKHERVDGVAYAMSGAWRCVGDLDAAVTPREERLGRPGVLVLSQLSQRLGADPEGVGEVTEVRVRIGGEAHDQGVAQPDVVGPELAHEATAHEDRATVALARHALRRVRSTFTSPSVPSAASVTKDQAHRLIEKFHGLRWMVRSL